MIFLSVTAVVMATLIMLILLIASIYGVGQGTENFWIICIWIFCTFIISHIIIDTMYQYALSLLAKL